jgi:hypothetical protein
LGKSWAFQFSPFPDEHHLYVGEAACDMGLLPCVKAKDALVIINMGCIL